jgi:hypothetical protein
LRLFLKLPSSKKIRSPAKDSCPFGVLPEINHANPFLMNLLRLSRLALLLLVSTSSCKKDDGDDCPTIATDAQTGIAPGGCVIVDPCAEPCAPDVICTMIFAEVSATAVGQNNATIVPDSFVVTDLAGAPLPPVAGQPVYGMSSTGDGRLTIVNDAWVQGHQGMQMDVRAKGFSNSTLLFDQAFTIGADCCHVYKASGPDVISVL